MFKHVVLLVVVVRLNAPGACRAVVLIFGYILCLLITAGTLSPLSSAFLQHVTAVQVVL